MSRVIMYKLDTGDNSLTKITDVTPIKENNQIDIAYFYAPYGTDMTKVKFLPQRFFDLTNVNPIPAFKMTRETDEEVVLALVPEASQESNWSLYYFPIGLGISGILKSNRATKYDIGFQRYEIDINDEDYLGEFATAETVAATVNAELKVAYAAAVADNYVNVYQTTNNVYKSWEFDGADWAIQSTVFNEGLIENTLAYRETFKAAVLSNDDFNTGDPSELALVLNAIYAELADINTVLASIIGVQGDLMAKADYADEGTAEDSVKFARNVGELADSIPYSTVKTKLGYIDQDVKVGSNPTFGTVIMDELRLNGDVEVGSQSY